MSVDLVKEMSLTPSEFKRQLLRLCEQFELDANEVGGGPEGGIAYQIKLSDYGVVCVRSSVLPPRKIASISLPVMKVEFSFKGVENKSVDEFMKKFNLYFRKGGG